MTPRKNLRLAVRAVGALVKADWWREQGRAARTRGDTDSARTCLGIAQTFLRLARYDLRDAHLPGAR